MNEKDIEALVDDLFTNGAGQVATRLVLMDDTTGKNLGGWGRAPLADRVREWLADRVREWLATRSASGSAERKETP